MLTRYPWWVVFLDPADGKKMRSLFKDFLADLPFSQTELAKALGVEQPTVSRWASGKSTPNPDQMQAVVAVVESRMAEIMAEVQEKVQLTKQVLDAAKDVAASQRSMSDGGFKKLKTAREKLRKLLQKQPRWRRQARTKRRKSPKSGQR